MSVRNCFLVLLVTFAIFVAVTACGDSSTSKKHLDNDAVQNGENENNQETDVNNLDDNGQGGEDLLDGLHASLEIHGLAPDDRVISPVTIIADADDSTCSFCVAPDGGGDQKAIAYSNALSFHFTFDDSDSGNFATTGNSRNYQIGESPRAIHTFECSGSDDPNWVASNNRCEFTVKVRAQASDGTYDDAEKIISVLPQSTYYDADDTICVSKDSVWTGCEGSTRLTDSPTETTDLSGKRILYSKSDTDPDHVYSDLLISHADKNVTVDSYGEGVYRATIGVIKVGSEFHKKDSRVSAWDFISKDSQGRITKGFAYNMRVTNLRAGIVSMGTATNVTVHNMDLDWSKTPNENSYGEVVLAGYANECAKVSGLSCSKVQYPYGIFVSDTVVKGYPVLDKSKLPLVNISCFNAGLVVNSGIVGVETKNANEHNMRVMGSWGLAISNVWLRGNHLGGEGAKHNLALRSPGFGTNATEFDLSINPEQIEGTSMQRGDVYAKMYQPRYNVVIDSKMGDTNQNPASNQAVHIEYNDFQHYGGVYGSEIISMPGHDSTSKQCIKLNGKYLYAAFNIFPYDYLTVLGNSGETSDGELISKEFQDVSTIFAFAEDWSLSPASSGKDRTKITAKRVTPLAPQ